jgi:hypothetical protein
MASLGVRLMKNEESAREANLPARVRKKMANNIEESFTRPTHPPPHPLTHSRARLVHCQLVGLLQARPDLGIRESASASPPLPFFLFSRANPR